MTATVSPMTEEERRVHWWKGRFHEARAALDLWRSCPAPGCDQGRYRYSSRRAQWKHLQQRHGAKP